VGKSFLGGFRVASPLLVHRGGIKPKDRGEKLVPGIGDPYSTVPHLLLLLVFIS
jgi:hypothetical protein